MGGFWQRIWGGIWQRALPLGLAIVCGLAFTACANPQAENRGARRTPTITEVSPPAEIQRLSRFLDRYQPQVQILAPTPDAVLTTDAVTVQLAIADLPIFRHPEFGLGPHIDVILDEREHQEVFDLSQPLVFSNLAPGTHTLRAFASRPWQESFKNKEAYAQVTFHVYEKTAEHAPLPNTPLLAYNGPEGEYGGEPILLDFYLRNLPLNVSLLSEEASSWQVRVTVDGESFVLDRWQSPYLQGWQPGRHVVKLELLDENGRLLPGPFNSTARFVTYTPNGRDTLSRLVRGETLPGIEAIVNPDYAPLPTAEPAVETETKPEAAPEAVTAPPSPEPPAKPAKKKRERPLKKAKASPAVEPTPEVPAATEPPIAPVEPLSLPEPAVVVPTEPETAAPAPMAAEPETAPPTAPVEPVVPPTLEGTPVPVAEPIPESAKAAQVQKLHELLQKRLQEKG
ncbi:MAG: hypothetical protein SNJ60_04980 [Pseudanabaenaceae cyanobacterium]